MASQAGRSKAGRKKNKPAQKRYVAEDRRTKNKARRIEQDARRARTA